MLSWFLQNKNKTYQEKLDELDGYQKDCMKSIAHQRYRMGIISKSIKEWVLLWRYT